MGSSLLFQRPRTTSLPPAARLLPCYPVSTFPVGLPIPGCWPRQRVSTLATLWATDTQIDRFHHSGGCRTADVVMLCWRVLPE